MVQETNADVSAKLIVGLGNPGEKYQKTRHNLGFEVLKAFALKQHWSFKREARLQGKIAGGLLSPSGTKPEEEKQEQKIFLLLPMTFMNLSGQSVRKALHYFKIPLENLLIVVDDVYVKLGDYRMRPKGSSGGHNGLKSIEYELRTQNYWRLRMGVGPKDEQDLPDGKERFLEHFVLGNFSREEETLLPETIEKGVQGINSWIFDGNKKAEEKTL